MSEQKDDLRKLVRTIVFLLAFAVSGIASIGVIGLLMGVATGVGSLALGSAAAGVGAMSDIASVIPKLFAPSAKAKASEVGPAAGTWVKLQLAYMMEKDNVGSCEQISYTMPGNGKTANFSYGCGIQNDGSAYWFAKNNENLDDCPAGSQWALLMISGNEEPEVILPDSKACQRLTPNFDKIGKLDKSAKKDKSKRAEKEAAKKAEAKAEESIEDVMKLLEEAKAEESIEDVMKLLGDTGKMTDPRDGKEYKTVVIGNQTWLAENLNYTDQCGEDGCDSDYENGRVEANGKYGMLYAPFVAQKACPVGWHLPSQSEWNKLIEAAGGKNAAPALKAKSGWKTNGTDKFGFGALPGGFKRNNILDGDYSPISTKDVGVAGNWWSSTKVGKDKFYDFHIDSKPDVRVDKDGCKGNEYDYGDCYLLSVRCIKD